GNAEGTVSAPVTWDEIDDCEPGDFTIATMPDRYEALGDLHHDIDDHVFDLAPLLEWADRDEAEGNATPPEPDEP
ncbi:MAG: ATP-dependent DNA ligase, partial [Marmoricola sp.]